MKAAIYLKNNIICKTTNLQKKLKKETQPIEVLEEWDYKNDLNKIDEKYNYWKNLLNRKEEKEIEETKMYYFKNPKTGETIVSIYPELDNVKSYIKDWYDYERVDQTKNG